MTMNLSTVIFLAWTSQAWTDEGTRGYLGVPFESPPVDYPLLLQPPAVEEVLLGVAAVLTEVALGPL